MGCINPDGSLTPVATQVLRGIAALHGAALPEAVARATGLPLYRARASLRELAAAGFVREEGGAHHLTDEGLAKAGAAVEAAPSPCAATGAQDM